MDHEKPKSSSAVDFKGVAQRMRNVFLTGKEGKLVGKKLAFSQSSARKLRRALRQHGAQLGREGPPAASDNHTDTHFQKIEINQ